MSANPKHKLTFTEYVEIERHAKVKNEFMSGKLYPVEVASSYHIRLVNNIYTSLLRQTAGKEIQVFGSLQLIELQEIEKGYYPDIAIVCGRPRFDDTSGYALLNPTILIEVLSDASAGYDRGKKFEDYQLLKSFGEYILVSQSNRIEQYVRQETHVWVYREYRNPDDRVYLENINSTLLLKEVYL